jgi:uncharacterized protein YqeY
VGDNVFKCPETIPERTESRYVMSLAEQIQQDTKAAMKSRDKPRVATLRMLNAAIKNRRIELGRDLEEEEERAVLRKQLKQREESAEAFRKAGREDRAEAENAEAEVIRGYLPAPLAPEELDEIAARAVEESGASGMKDMGAAMGRAMELAGGRAAGKELSERVRSHLQGK